MARFSTNPHEIEAAFAVGLWHDIAREWSDDALLTYCLIHKLAMEPEELAQPMLLHGLVASALLTDTMAESSPAWTLAVRWHTLGSRTMGILGAVLFIADFLEPTRTHLEAVERTTLLESHTLEEMCVRIIQNQNRFLSGKGIPTARSTSSLMEFLLEGGRF